MELLCSSVHYCWRYITMHSCRFDLTVILNGPCHSSVYSPICDKKAGQHMTEQLVSSSTIHWEFTVCGTQQPIITRQLELWQARVHHCSGENTLFSPSPFLNYVFSFVLSLFLCCSPITSLLYTKLETTCICCIHTIKASNVSSVVHSLNGNVNISLLHLI